MEKLILLDQSEYRGVSREDPIRFYYWPFFGRLYRRRVEMALYECRGGERVLEVGFGTGLSFLNLSRKYQEVHGLDLTADIQEVQEVFRKHQIKPQLKNGDVVDLPYADGMFDTVLLISILEHLDPDQLEKAFQEIERVLKPSGQMVYGVPVERPLMVVAFRLLGVDIREHHYSTHREVRQTAHKVFQPVRVLPLKTLLGQVYEVGHFEKRM